MKQQVRDDLLGIDTPKPEQMLEMLFWYYFCKDEHFEWYVREELRVKKDKPDETRYVHKFVTGEDGKLEYKKVLVDE